MSRFSSYCLAIAFAVMAGAAQGAEQFSGVGRPATPAEIKAWDIDVRPDFKGLPPGSGSVARGEAVWEAKCTECHGTFAESREVFGPLIAFTTQDDIKSGHCQALRKEPPERSTLCRVSTLSTLWDYVNRAMPWTAPKSLPPDDVYAVVAYMLHLGEVLPADFTLSDNNIRDVQGLMPNRKGMTTDHALWPGKAFSKARPDTKNTACMKNCKPEVRLASSLPDYAWNAHGNIAEQNRPVGQTRGRDTSGKIASAPLVASRENPALELARTSGCMACHGLNNKIVGPGYNQIAKKYGPDSASLERLSAKVRKGGQGVWGNTAMPPHEHVKEDDIRALVRWILAGAPAR